MSEEARARVVDAIRDHGPITFAEYMELALYGPGGYYDSPPVGTHGDFVTSPHVHPVFGALLGTAIRELWRGLGSPDPFRLVEIGAGDGTLLRQLTEALHDVPVDPVAVEISAGAREALGAIEGLGVATEPPEAADVVLAHELLDNLPFRVVRGSNEVRVALDDRERLVEREVAVAKELLPFATAPADEVVIPTGALELVDHIGDMLRPGYAVLIDYGAAAPAGSAVHGYRGHRVIADVLAAPGETDVTAGVELGLVADRARERGLEVFGPVTQHRALVALGIDVWLRDELARQHRSLDERDGLGAVRTWSGRSRATLLVDPAGLGRMRWLVLASPGLAAPSWTSDAQP